jgi:hypothetical protein
MRALLYLTIWASMIALGLSEWRRRGHGRGGRPAFLVSAAGLALLVIHIAIAIVHHHGGDHAAAVAETARLTEEVYGVAWGGGVYVNYAFVATWAAYLWWWQRRMDVVIDSRRLPVLVLRGLLLVLIVNALVIFASAQTRPLGVVICAVLLWAWRPGAARQEFVTSRSSATSTLRSRT